MSYIPKAVQWFVAQLVEEFRVQGHKRNVIHINYVLIEATKPEEAYCKALQVGRQANMKYKNPSGKWVVHRFVGIRNLDVVYFPIEHGCELLFEERIGVAPAAVRKLVRRKSNLEVFRPVPLRRPKGRPDYSSEEIIDIVSGKAPKRKAR